MPYYTCIVGLGKCTWVKGSQCKKSPGSQYQVLILAPLWGYTIYIKRYFLAFEEELKFLS